MIEYVVNKIQLDQIPSIRWPKIFGENACSDIRCRIGEEDVFSLLRINSVDNDSSYLDVYVAHTDKMRADEFENFKLMSTIEIENDEEKKAH